MFSPIINIYRELPFRITHSFVDMAGQEDVLCISLVRLQTYTIVAVYRLMFFLSPLQEHLNNSDGLYFLLYITLRLLAEVAVACVYASRCHPPIQHIRF